LICKCTEWPGLDDIQKVMTEELYKLMKHECLPSDEVVFMYVSLLRLYPVYLYQGLCDTCSIDQ